MADDNRPRVPFSYWSDPLCIWAFVAQPKLDRILEDRGEDLEVDYHVVPVFGSVRWRFERGPWAEDGVEGRVAKTRRIAHEHGREDVSGECWRQDCPSGSWSPGAALEAVWDLERQGLIPPGKGAAYQLQMREWFFVHDRNIARRQVQLALAEELGVAREGLEQRLDDGSALATLWQDHREKEALHIQGSPTYVFEGGRAMLYGNFSFGVLQATVDELIRRRTPGASAC